MNSSGKDILLKFKKRWQLLMALEAILYAFGFAIFIFLLTLNLLPSIFGFVFVILFAIILIKPWQPNLSSVSSYIDRKLDLVEYSTSLFHLPESELSSIAKIQQVKIVNKLADHIKEIIPPNHLLRAGFSSSFLILIGLLISLFGLFEMKKTVPNAEIQNEIVNFQNNDSTQSSFSIPQIRSQSVTINYPSYTNIRTIKSSNMDIKALEGSFVQWELIFDSEVDSVIMKSMNNIYSMLFKNGSYTGNSKLSSSGFYSFEFYDLQGNSYASDLYQIEVIKDKGPTIEIKSIEQFTSFEYYEGKILDFQTVVTDDYGIDEAYIIATVSKGSGESVKFREEKLQFSNTVSRGRKKSEFDMKIDLDAMNMGPGDELYFYIESSDLRKPISNVSRTETLFAVIKDTTSYEFGIEGTLGVDQMPDYFRSQRQLIIDTEKLISERSSRTKKDFNFISNELGYDQKALRLKYAEFMGEETDSGLDIGAESDPLAEDEHNDDENDDPLAEYTHDHDSENEHNLVDTNAKEDKEKSNNPLQEYTHDHGDPEMATLFEESHKTKLRNALNEMWDAELYLRLYQPEQSLPYQYKALKLIQDIKNSARIYVHRIGFDPPPIKEDKRLTGDIDDISNYFKNESFDPENIYPNIRNAISRLDQLIDLKEVITETDLQLFENAGNELAVMAVENPGKYFQTLQLLKQVADGKENSIEVLRDVKKGLILAIPKQLDNPNRSRLFTDKINQLMLKELNFND